VLWSCWLGGRKGIRPIKTEWWVAGMVICLKRGADLHMAQLMPLQLTVSCFSKIQIGFAFLVPAHPGSPEKRAVKRACVCACVYNNIIYWRGKLVIGTITASTPSIQSCWRISGTLSFHNSASRRLRNDKMTIPRSEGQDPSITSNCTKYKTNDSASIRLGSEQWKQDNLGKLVPER